MKTEDLKEMFIIMSLSRALDDRLLMIDDSKLRHMNKVIFKRLIKESGNLYKQLDNKLGINSEMIDEMSDVIHKAINDVKDKMDVETWSRKAHRVDRQKCSRYHFHDGRRNLKSRLSADGNALSRKLPQPQYY